MTKTRRIIHHACWFALLGPHMGVPVTIAGDVLTSYRSLSGLLLQILHILPLFMALTWFFGGLAALLTGIAVACLPPPVYTCRWKRIMAGGCAGAFIASLCGLPFTRELALPCLWISTGPGLLAGCIMGWLAPHLPFRGDKKRLCQERMSINTDVV